MALTFLGLTLAIRGEADDARVALRELAAIEIGDAPPFERVYLAQLALWQSDLPAAVDAARAVVEPARTVGTFKQQAAIQAERIQGEVALAAGDLARAADHLSEAVARAHAVNHAEEGLPALVALAEVRRRQRDLAAARSLIVEARELAERGPYRCSTPTPASSSRVSLLTSTTPPPPPPRPPRPINWRGVTARRSPTTGASRGRGRSWPVSVRRSRPSVPSFDEARFEPMPEVALEMPEKFKPRD